MTEVSGPIFKSECKYHNSAIYLSRRREHNVNAACYNVLNRQSSISIFDCSIAQDFRRLRPTFASGVARGGHAPNPKQVVLRATKIKKKLLQSNR